MYHLTCSFSQWIDPIKSWIFVRSIGVSVSSSSLLFPLLFCNKMNLQCVIVCILTLSIEHLCLFRLFKMITCTVLYFTVVVYYNCPLHMTYYSSQRAFFLVFIHSPPHSLTIYSRVFAIALYDIPHSSRVFTWKKGRHHLNHIEGIDLNLLKVCTRAEVSKIRNALILQCTNTHTCTTIVQYVCIEVFCMHVISLSLLYNVWHMYVLECE